MQGEPTGRLPIVGVIGSGRHSHHKRASAVGVWLARQETHLLTGGGGGVMASVSQAFYQTPQRQGLVLGIIPGMDTNAGYMAKEGYPNPWVEIPIFTHLPLSGEQGADPMSRNHINILSSDVIITLPGSAGTASEVILALHYRRPLIAFLGSRQQIAGLPAQTLVEPDLDKVKRFVLEHIRDGRSG